MLKYGGASILILFGIKFIFDGILSSYAPSTITTDYQVQKVFFESIIFTASNPLTIVVWAGIFSSKLSEENIIKKDAYLFAVGLVLSTITFLAGVALIGSITKIFLPQLVVTLLNIIVGMLIIGFGIRQINA
ncbi:LysE family transporter [Methanobacterium sp.]|uniref:LysE family transporter n=1 Tax=Methanobacterium sp. TaxID=2164 RepID=UPI003C76C264